VKQTGHRFDERALALCRSVLKRRVPALADDPRGNLGEFLDRKCFEAWRASRERNHFFAAQELCELADRVRPKPPPKRRQYVVVFDSCFGHAIGRSAFYVEAKRDNLRGVIRIV
jgi:hypothetical protein